MLGGVTSPRLLTRVGSVAAVSASGAGVLSGAAGAVLARVYRPHAPGVEVALISADARDTERWLDWQLYALTALLVAAVAALVVTWMLRRRGGPAAPTVLAAAGVVSAAAALWTRPLVQWDQLALWAVTVGDGISGYWYAAFNGGVRFLLIDGAEVSQGQYAPALMVHLAAPVLATVTLACAALLTLRQGGTDRGATRS